MSLQERIAWKLCQIASDAAQTSTCDVLCDICLREARGAVEATIEYYDELAKSVSNIGEPRSDNEYGRVAAMVERSFAVPVEKKD